LGSKLIKILCIQFGNPKPFYEIRYFLFRKQTVPNTGNYKEKSRILNRPSYAFTGLPTLRLLRRRFAYTSAFVPQETLALYTTKSLNFIMLINKTLPF